MNSTFAQQITPSDCITVDDLGGYKWILSGEGKKGEVVIFRQTTTSVRGGEKDVEVYDTIHYSPNKEVKQAALFLNATFLIPDQHDNPSWYFRYMSTSNRILGKFIGSSSDKDHASITFAEKNGNSTSVEFRVLIMPYADAAKMYTGPHGGLPPMPNEGSWVCCLFPKCDAL